MPIKVNFSYKINHCQATSYTAVYGVYGGFFNKITMKIHNFMAVNAKFMASLKFIVSNLHFLPFTPVYAYIYNWTDLKGYNLLKKSQNALRSV
jgi:hypothetical protein